MPTSSSDSEGTSERPRRRTSPRSPSSAPARRPSTRSKKIGTEDSVAPAPSVSDDDFGSGVVNEERPARQPREVQQWLSPSRQWRVPRKSQEFRKLEASVPQRSEELAVHGQLLQMLLPNRLLLNQSEAKELQADLSDRLLMLSPRPE